MKDDAIMVEETLEEWVMTKVNTWADHYEANYREKHDEYYRLWRGIWASDDRSRVSERSRMIAPALQQAVESSAAELEEATFGRGKFFDISDDLMDEEDQDIALMRNKLHEDFEAAQVRRCSSECIVNAAVYGNGIAEVVLESIKEQKVATKPVMGGELTAVGVNISDRVIVKMVPVLPHNFRIDPLATSINDALGCAVDRFVSLHHIEMLQEDGTYDSTVDVGTSATASELEPDKELKSIATDDKVRLTKYFGFVPRHLIEKAETDTLADDEMLVPLDDPDKPDNDKSYYVEALVVIGNEGHLLKAEANPYMLTDRPIINFQWDVTPSVFWGRGVCEKGYNSQKALDTELRARMDALALTVHPMMAMDATRIPRGHKPEVRPGKLLLTNGDPKEILHPFNFGQVNQITFAQAAELQKMVQTATGAIDSAGMPQAAAQGDGTAAGISMSLGAVIKRHKRTLINFQQGFLIPFVRMAANRYMQYSPEAYPVKDFKFNVTSSLGLMAREFEVGQLTQLLQTMPPESAPYSTILTAVIDNMNISNREMLIKQIKEANAPDEEAQAAQQAAQKAELDFKAGQTELLNAQAAESNERANKYIAEARVIPEDSQTRRIAAITDNLSEGDSDEDDFRKRLQIAEMFIKGRDMDLKESKEKFAQRTARLAAVAPVAPATQV